MELQCLRRLPVEGFGGTIMGIVSMNDIILAAGPRKPVRDADVLSPLRTPVGAAWALGVGRFARRRNGEAAQLWGRHPLP